MGDGQRGVQCSKTFLGCEQEEQDGGNGCSGPQVDPKLQELPTRAAPHPLGPPWAWKGPPAPGLLGGGQL